MLVYAALKCYSTHESGFELISLHFSKADAYRACRSWWVQQWLEWNCDFRDDGLHGVDSSKVRRRRYSVALASKAWAVKPFIVS